MKFTDDEKEKKFLANTSDKDHETLSGVTKAEVMNAMLSQEKLIAERRIAIDVAYQKLPNPAIVPELMEYRIPYVSGKIRLVTKDFTPDDIDYYTFVRYRNRWVMTVEEFNRHTLKGIFI